MKTAKETAKSPAATPVRMNTEWHYYCLLKRQQPATVLFLRDNVYIYLRLILPPSENIQTVDYSATIICHVFHLAYVLIETNNTLPVYRTEL